MKNKKKKKNRKLKDTNEECFCLSFSFMLFVGFLAFFEKPKLRKATSSGVLDFRILHGCIGLMLRQVPRKTSGGGEEQFQHTNQGVRSHIFAQFKTKAASSTALQ
eukprot:scaffold424_cov165-Ochromonas_danica.AAC.14